MTARQGRGSGRDPFADLRRIYVDAAHAEAAHHVDIAADAAAYGLASRAEVVAVPLVDEKHVT